MKKLLKLMVAFLLLASLAGCLLTSEEVIPWNSRKPYLGDRIDYGTRESPRVLSWSTQRRRYVSSSDDSGGFVIAPVKEVLPDATSSSPGAKDYIVQMILDERGKSLLLFLRINDASNVAGEKTYKVKTYHLSANELVSHVARYRCLRDSDPKACIFRHFDPGSPSNLATLLRDGPKGGASVALSGQAVWEVAIDDEMAEPFFAVANKGRWRDIVDAAIGRRGTRNLDLLERSPLFVEQEIEVKVLSSSPAR